jgi:hypothetical protein
MGGDVRTAFKTRINAGFLCGDGENVQGRFLFFIDG